LHEPFVTGVRRAGNFQVVLLGSPGILPLSRPQIATSLTLGRQRSSGPLANRCRRHRHPALQSLAAVEVEKMYQFRGYSLANVSQVQLAGGVAGRVLAYTSR